MFQNVSELSDVVSVLMYYTADDSYLLSQDPNTKEVWIPSIKTTDSWRLTARKLVKEVCNFDTTSEQAIKFYRVWLPSPAQEIHHIVYKVPVSLEVKKRTNAIGAKSKMNMTWMTVIDIMKPHFVKTLKSPELVDFIATIKGIELKSPSKPITAENGYPEGSWMDVLGYQTMHHLIEILEKHVIVSTEARGDVSLTTYEQLVDYANLNKSYQCTLFKQFLMYSFPCMYMSRYNFTNYLLKLGWNKDVTPDIFRAADVYNMNALSFRDFLYIIAALEPHTQRGSVPNELRSRYIFRFFDKNGDSILEYQEFMMMLQSIKKLNNLPTDPVVINKETDAIYRGMGIQINAPIRMADFLAAVGSLKLRGTSALLRSPKSILGFLQDTVDIRQPVMTTVAAKAPDRSTGKGAQSTSSTTGDSLKKTRSGVVVGSEYEVATHTVKLTKGGTIIDIDQLWNIDNAAVSKSSNFIQTKKFERLVSMDAFSQKSVSNELLRGLHYFAQPITPEEASKKPGRKPKDAFTWGLVDPGGFANCLLTICEKARDILKEESRLLEISSPVYVLGDLHGNFPDLMCFEKILWHLGPSLTPITLLFLGDYVDRGPYGIEVIAYLLAYKVQNPMKLKLLRGNHEIREIQKMFTFFSECTYKFGDSLGSKVWNSVNGVFDTMPIAAVIDGKIFCCHGGIPPPWLCPVVSTIKTIPCPLVNPDEQSPLAWEIMWNDPVRQPMLTENIAIELLTHEGFATNTRRGTAHVFSAEALERFLMVNGFTHVIRAHEVQHTGFQIQLKGKLITVFSSSRYCGGNNEAACVLADYGKLRMFRLDTA